MKKMIFVCVLVALISSHAMGQLGGWFKWSNPQYVPTSKDYSEIIRGINNDLVKAGEWYELSSGDKYQVIRPVDWRDLVFQTYYRDDKSVTLENLAEHVASSEDTFWGDDFSTTTSNYYWSKDGMIKVVENYNGQTAKVPILVKNGRIKLKRNCGNPQEEPELPSVVLQKSEVHVSFDELVVRHKMDTLVVVHLIQNQVEQKTADVVPDQEKKEKTWFRRNLPWLIPVGTAIIAGTVYALTKKSKATPIPGQGKDPDLEVPEKPTPGTGQGQDGGLG